jgi:hypothetical protein
MKKHTSTKKLDRRIMVAVLIGFMAGVIWLVAARFVSYQSDAIHYHANFALYINGQKDEFKSFTFFEEVQSCGSDEENPRNRVHMHNQEGHVAHVHEAGMTWGYFFANLGYTLGDTLINTDDGTFLDGQNGELTFILNGKPVDHIANEIIRSEDTLLINYGKDSTATLNQRYESIPKDAAKFNRSKDPSSCSGGEELTAWQRLKKAFGVAE